MTDLAAVERDLAFRPETPSQEKHKPDDRWRGFQRPLGEAGSPS
jgi:hypothetical protein